MLESSFYPPLICDVHVLKNDLYLLVAHSPFFRGNSLTGYINVLQTTIHLRDALIYKYNCTDPCFSTINVFPKGHS